MTGTHRNFYYRIHGHPGLLTPEAPLWDTPLVPHKENLNGAGSADISIGAYLTAAGKFLCQDEFKGLVQGIGDLLKKKISAEDLHKTTISLIKHGAYYHPCKVTVLLHSGETLDFALNGAVSEPGISLVAHEFSLLRELTGRSSSGFLPRVFSAGTQTTPAFQAIGFFLSEWFEGFHEFHITRAASGYQVVVWDTDTDSNIFIPEPDYFTIYRQAAEILTAFYNCRTFEQIFPWHHAAGDFVLRRSETGRLAVRLITVRGYSALLEPAADTPSAEDMFSGILFFLVTLSLRMRIDRLDGTGDFHFITEEILPDILKGFFAGLQASIQHSGIDRTFFDAFTRFIHELDTDDISEFCLLVARSCHPDAPETPLIFSEIEAHAARLNLEIMRCLKKSFFIDKGKE